MRISEGAVEQKSQRRKHFKLNSQPPSAYPLLDILVR